ncbi:MAG: tetratricopeptide repeat protein [Phycisphaeraceae bacterium]|nr:tetratricopeptide repeat protein [Phycisphaeraceae bacterium]MCW5763641.1 tetratricopeptide repeat protein [Phycisphaeraceae bacterium]
MSRTMSGCCVVLLMLLGGCSAQQQPVSSPYATPSEVSRNTVLAQQLTEQAIEQMERHPDKAERLLREALTADLYYGPAHNNLGIVYLSRGMLYEAASEFEWARKLMPGHPDPRMNLALTLERAGRTDEALAAYDTALAVFPGHIQSAQALARLQLRTGRTDDRTPALLDDIALRGESDTWRQWALAQRLKMKPD